MNKEVIESICQNAKLKKIEKNFESKTNVKSRKHEKSPLLVRGRVLEWKPLKELNIGIIEF